MTIVFERPVGAHLDVKELEYVAALHQTGAALRTDASITSEDVINFLMSRHGIHADKDFVEQRLMPGLAGAMGDDPSAVFDICELVSILIMPHLKEVANKDDDFEKHLLFGKVLEIILLDVFGEKNAPPKLDHDTMVAILETYGEVGIPPQVIDEMLDVAGVLGNPDAEFDVDALMRATTSDAKQYDLKWLDHPSTHYDNVFHGTSLDVATKNNRSSRALGEEEDKGEETMIVEHQEQEDGDFLGPIRKVLSLSTVDYVAENYSSKIFASILWLLVVIMFFVYTFDVGEYVGSVNCDGYSSEFGCHIVEAIFAWLAIFGQLSVLGTSFVVLASAGNGIYHNSIWLSTLLTLVGMGTIGFATIGTFEWDFSVSWPFQDSWFSSEKSTTLNDDTGEEEVDPLYNVGYTLVFALGIILLLIQLKTFIFILIPRDVLTKLPGVSYFLVPGIVSSEHATKLSATFKVDKMVGNALAMHAPDPKSSTTRSMSSHRRSTTQGAFGNALLNFQATSDDREQCGGILWTFKRMWNKTVFTEDGVWIHSRLISSNMSQIFVALFYVTLGTLLLLSTSDLFTPVADDDAAFSDDAAVVNDDPAFNNVFTFTPTVSPPPTVSPFPSSDFVGEAVNSALEWAPERFGFLAFQGREFEERFYNNPEISPNVASVASGILNAVPDDVVENIASWSDMDVLAKFVDVSKQVLGISDENATDNTGGDFEQRRRLQFDADNSTVHEWQVIFAVALGGIAALAATISLVATWLPSSISTILQFRSGVLGSLRDKEFQGYRVAPDLTTILFGSTFWGCVYASGTIFIATAGVLFFLVWGATRPLIIRILSQVVGIAVTIIIKTVVLIALRHLLYNGFFRKHPLGANLLLVVVECWSLGLTVGTMLLRLVKLIAVAFFYIARIDTPFLAKGVGNIFGAPLDSSPMQFRKDLLVHDAHHHPYMERLGVIYMLKLRYGDAFGTRAGSAWRLVVVLALMPWLRRYRLDDDEKEEDLEHAQDGGDGGEWVRPREEDDGQSMKREIIKLRLQVKTLEMQLAKSREKESNQVAFVEINDGEKSTKVLMSRGLGEAPLG